MPELAHGGVDGRPIHLTWRDGGVDHAAGLAFDQVPDLGPGRGAAIRGGGERAGLHGEAPCASKHYPHTDASVALGLRVTFRHTDRQDHPVAWLHVFWPADVRGICE